MINNNTSTLEAIIDFAWASGASIDFVNEAKKELKTLIKMLQMIEKNSYIEHTPTLDHYKNDN